MPRTATARRQKVCLLSAHNIVLQEFGRLLLRKGSFQLEHRKLDPLFNPLPSEAELPRAGVYVVDADSPQMAERVVGSIAIHYPQAKTLVVGEAFADERAFPLLRLGVKGIVTHQQLETDLPRAVEAVAAGGYWVTRNLLSRFVDSIVRRPGPQVPLMRTSSLSRREKDVVQGLLENFSNKEIALHLNISERTVKFHVSNLLEKFGVRRRTDLILMCFQESQKLRDHTADLPGQAG